MPCTPQKKKKELQKGRNLWHPMKSTILERGIIYSNIYINRVHTKVKPLTSYEI